MPSLRGRLSRLMIKHWVAPSLRRAGSVHQLRSTLDQLTKFQRVPAGTEIRPALVNGTAAEWIRAPRAESDRAILYLHGGALVMGSPFTHRELAARLSDSSGIIVLALDYRLAPEHPFPAAMRDAMSAYAWLLDQGYAAEHLAVGGDSAGGGLALQTLIALKNEGSSLPAAAFFMSPQTDWVRFDGESYSTRGGADFWYNPEMYRRTASYYVGGNDPETALLSPVNGDLFGLPPICVHVGDHDVLLSDAVRFAERARACDVDVELKIWKGMWHVFQASARFVPEARRSIDEIGRFIVGHVT